MTGYTSDFLCPSILQPIKVPPGYYPIEVAQFWRGEYSPGRPRQLHWAIVVRTSAKRGNCHEIVGDIHTYKVHHRFDMSLKAHYQRDDWRGSHVVGYVSPNRLDKLLNRIARIPVVRHDRTWNGQHWVHGALEGLRHVELYTDGYMTFAALQTHMCHLLEAWEIGEI